ncbi:uncharacterized protein (TIGR04141 family) [Microbacterium halimionae]|uniref:Uncharacterized protein (TIGR04141 family) n=1 Tax=Microbacterium halimionae TaxID=1526413 RepID=A0A7W3PLP0_9MICO|nr:DUF6119 family protein [Microbacterium halimionae]MBA8816373.1 uncharacterized protein (TIGR04141 family) [Microbacterium halimionae]NII96575.1 uncharacterized protein (TIGR04141 family) [Microbacterium halimionae]
MWLLKAGFDATTSLADDHKLDGPIAASHVPQGASLYINDSSPRAPWWRDYFGISQELKQSQKAALLFVPAGNRICVVTFGNTIHNLRPDCYEYDFGLIITLNCVDPNKLRNTDTADPGAARRQRTQTAIGSDITYFDVERDTHVLRSLTGAAKSEYAEILKNVTGSAQVRFSTTRAASKLPGLCAQLVELYEKDDYKLSFPDVRNVRPVKDPTTVSALNDKLVAALQAKSDDPQLALPELIDYADAKYFRFNGDGPADLYEDLELSAYYDYLKLKEVKRKQLTYEKLVAQRVLVLDENEQQRTSYALTRCIIFDTKLDGRSERFHLMDGSWFALEKSYIERIKSDLAPLFTGETLPSAKSGHEADYNIELAATLGAICLDKTSVSPSGLTQVEPCDVLSIDPDGTAVFSHVKMGTGSAELSHLFYQGQNATTLILTDVETAQKLAVHIENLAPTPQLAADLRSAIDLPKVRVRFAIVTRKPLNGALKNLPLFSQLSLARAARVFRGLRVPLSVVFIDDSRPVVKPKPKARKPRGTGPRFTSS